MRPAVGLNVRKPWLLRALIRGIVWLAIYNVVHGTSLKSMRRFALTSSNVDGKDPGAKDFLKASLTGNARALVRGQAQDCSPASPD